MSFVREGLREATSDFQIEIVCVTRSSDCKTCILGMEWGILIGSMGLF